MAKKRNSDDADYEVGYRKPPKHSQFVPGQSGNQGRRKKVSESHAQIIARIRDEMVSVNGKDMSKFELAVTQAFNQTIKSGKPRDLKLLLELLDKYGAISKFDLQAEMEAGAEEAMLKISKVLSRTLDVNPHDMAARKRDDVAEAEMVMGCPHCGPALRKRWQDPEYKARLKRGTKSGLHKLVIDSRDAKGWEDYLLRAAGSDGT